jgi:hypothetical protein
VAVNQLHERPNVGQQQRPRQCVDERFRFGGYEGEQRNGQRSVNASVNTPFNVAVNANLHNNGAVTPVNADLSTDLTVLPRAVARTSQPRPG